VKTDSGAADCRPDNKQLNNQTVTVSGKDAAAEGTIMNDARAATRRPHDRQLNNKTVTVSGMDTVAEDPFNE